ncbi:conjugal transfer protein TraH [Endozoicomonas sp. ONNA1]|uniref:conjugal transfer protein TraH n=1 Tax=Endozoicomonas sp. ONNA1 TaxID=2828740 RepID=UPI0021473958|nr:conjugal transfer protein TraH [Endozoicomonas sp. ONNA1]
MKLINRLLVKVMVVLPLPLYAGGWVDDWFDNANVGSSSSYESQKRGYYSAGSFSGRINMGNDSLVTIAKPRISAGCGGIDAFMGGISFLDADYLVEKLENMLQAAPAVAFDMALKTMCKECSETITKMEAASDWLNSLQLNECAATQKFVSVIKEGAPEALSATWNEINNGVSLDEAMDRSWQEAQEKVKANDGEATADLKIATSGCPAEFKAVFKTGSVLAHATAKVGMGDYSDLMRGFIGDVMIKATAAEKIPLAEKVLACKENRQTTIDDILTGNLYKQSATGVCSKDTTTSLVKYVEDNLKSISGKIKNGQQLAEDEESFIKTTTSLPIYRSLVDGIARGNVDTKIIMMRDIVAVTYAHAIFNDLYAHIDRAFKYIEKVATNPGIAASASGQQCNLQVYQQPIAQFRGLHSMLYTYREMSLADYNNKIIDLNNALEVARSMKQEGDNTRAVNALDYHK